MQVLKLKKAQTQIKYKFEINKNTVNPKLPQLWRSLCGSKFFLNNIA